MSMNCRNTHLDPIRQAATPLPERADDRPDIAQGVSLDETPPDARLQSVLHRDWKAADIVASPACRGLMSEEQGRGGQPQGEDKGGKLPELTAHACLEFCS